MCSPRRRPSRSSGWGRWRIAAFVILIACNASAADFAVIVGANARVSEVSMDVLKRVFALDTRHWEGGDPVAVLLPGSAQPAREVLLQRILHVDEPQLRQLILGKIYRGEITFPPRVPNSDRQAIEFVASAHNLVAIVPAEIVSGAQVRVLTIDGKRPGDEGYPLRR